MSGECSGTNRAGSSCSIGQYGAYTEYTDRYGKLNTYSTVHSLSVSSFSPWLRWACDVQLQLGWVGLGWATCLGY